MDAADAMQTAALLYAIAGDLDDETSVRLRTRARAIEERVLGATTEEQK